jgi:hypothetical protein
MMRCAFASRMVTVRLVSDCLADGCRPLGFRVPRGWLLSAWFQSASRMVAARLVSECHGTYASQMVVVLSLRSVSSSAADAARSLSREPD